MRPNFPTTVLTVLGLCGNIALFTVAWQYHLKIRMPWMFCLSFAIQVGYLFVSEILWKLGRPNVPGNR